MAITLYKRKYKIYKKKGNNKKKKFFKRIPRLPKRKIHSFKRIVKLNAIDLNSTNPLAGAGNISFRLNQLPNFNEFTNLFDSYRIKAVSIRFLPNITNFIPTGGNSQPTQSYNSQFQTCIDRNDLTNIDENAILQYDTYKMTPIHRIHKRYLKVNNFTDGQQEWNKWHSTSNTDITYYGLKWVYTGSQPTINNIYLYPYITYYLQCKSVI